MTAAAVFALSGLSGCHGKGQDTEGAPVVLEDASGEDGKEAKDGGVRDAGEDEQKVAGMLYASLQTRAL